MKQSLKQRLIGAVVLVALAVIFLPMLLTGPVDRGQVSVPVEIPPKPQVQPSSQLPQPDDETASRPPPSSITQAPTPVDEAGAAAGSEAEPEATASEPAADGAEPAASTAQSEDAEQQTGATETPEAGAEEPESVPEQGGFAVQVGGFRNRSNALGLRDRLRDRGYTVYVDQTEWKGGPLYRVRVGPVISESEAESLKSRLAREQELSGIVVSR